MSPPTHAHAPPAHACALPTEEAAMSEAAHQKPRPPRSCSAHPGFRTSVGQSYGDLLLLRVCPPVVWPAGPHLPSHDHVPTCWGLGHSPPLPQKPPDPA